MAGGKRELIWLLRCALALTTCAPLKRDTVPVVYAQSITSPNTDTQERNLGWHQDLTGNDLGC